MSRREVLLAVAQRFQTSRQYNGAEALPVGLKQFLPSTVGAKSLNLARLQVRNGSDCLLNL